MERSPLPFDSVLTQVGGASRYQLLVFLLMTIAKMMPTIMSVIPVFIAYKQDYVCRWSENNTDAVPGNGSLVLDKCHVYRNETPKLRTTCSEWDFDTSMFETTIRSRYQLVCGWDFLAELSTTLFFIGFVLGSACYGWLSDRLGRLVAILTSGTHLSLCCAAAGLAPNYSLFAVFRFVGGIGNGGLLATCFTMMAEVTDVKHRVIFSVLVHNGFSYGCCLLALVAFYIRDSLWMQVASALIMLAIWIFPILIPESPRWLYTTGRAERAARALAYVAKLNRRPFTDKLRDTVLRGSTAYALASHQQPEESVPLREEDTAVVHRSTGEGEVHGNVSVLVLFREKMLAITTIINWYSWFCVSAGFFAAIYTLGDIGGDLFLNFIYSALIELPARLVALFIAKVWGRVPTAALSLCFGGLGCFVNAGLIAFPHLKVGLQVMSVYNKFCFTAGFDIVWPYSGELYPTVIRNMGVGLGSMWARIGGTLAPQVSLLFVVWPPLPLIILGFVPFVCGLLVLLHPETLNHNMLETIDDMRELVRTRSRLGKILGARGGEEEASRHGQELEERRAEEATDDYVPRVAS